jgi:hypothetical protein
LDYQWHGDKEDPDMYICVRKALITIGLTLNNHWAVVFDECDPNDSAGGVTIFKKLY